VSGYNRNVTGVTFSVRLRRYVRYLNLIKSVLMARGLRLWYQPSSTR